MFHSRSLSWRGRAYCVKNMRFRPTRLRLWNEWKLEAMSEKKGNIKLWNSKGEKEEGKKKNFFASFRSNHFYHPRQHWEPHKTHKIRCVWKVSEYFGATVLHRARHVFVRFTMMWREMARKMYSRAKTIFELVFVFLMPSLSNSWEFVIEWILVV